MKETGLDGLAVAASGPKNAVYDKQKGEYEPRGRHGREKEWHMPLGLEHSVAVQLQSSRKQHLFDT